MRIDLVAIGLLLPAASLAAQQRALLRYAPDPGALVSTVTDVSTVVTVSGLPAIPDGAQFEERVRRFARQRVLDRGPNGWLVEVALDSTRAQWRPAGGAWRDGPPSSLDGSRARARINERFAVTGVESSGERDAEVLRALTGWLGGLDFTFPETPVPVGAKFETGARLAFSAEVTADSSLPLREMVVGDLALVLDSLTDRGTDTLLYFTFGGLFTPRDVRTAGEDGAVQATFTGGFAGRLIWSTGWEAFVSGAARLQVQARATATSARGAVNATIDWSTTITHRVRP